MRVGESSRLGSSSDGEHSFLFEVPVILEGASQAAEKEFDKAIRDYAERLSDESSYEEINGRASGAKVAEVTASSVIRAKEALQNKMASEVNSGRRGSMSVPEAFALAGSPLCSSAAGVMGSHLTGILQWSIFLMFGVLAVISVLYLLKRRLL